MAIFLHAYLFLYIKCVKGNIKRKKIKNLIITTTTIIIPKTAEATDAVNIEEEQSKRVSNHCISPFGTQLNKIATIDTNKETTNAWH